MNENELNKQFSSLRWGTGMPIIAITAAGMEQVRCRGSYSLKVIDSSKLQQMVPEIEQTAAWVGSHIVTKVTDVIGESASTLTSARQLSDKTVEICKNVKDRLNNALDEAGLEMTGFTIDAIEKM